jgi:hypothetical protein
MSQTKSVLLKTSSRADVANSGGKILITGLDAVKKSNIVDFSQINYRAEVAQVITIGASTYTPDASTKYTVKIGDRNRRDHGFTEQLRAYSYTTPADLTVIGANAAAQREAIHLALVAKINDTANNYVTAATLGGGAGFTVTDDAGYYPYNHQGMTNRLGASLVFPVTNEDGSGFASTDFAITTAAVYAVGEGERLLNNAPVLDFMTGNLISGELGAPKTTTGGVAVAGQKYNMFSITSLEVANIPTIGGSYRGFNLKTQQVWVDNGAGTSTANATGYASFEVEMQRAIFEQYKNDAPAIVELFDGAPVAGAKAGGAPVGTTGSENTLHLSNGNVLHYAILGAGQTLTAPAYTATGLQLDLDAADNEGAEYSAPVDAVSGKEFIVGRDEFSLIFKASIADVSDTDDCVIGFRKKEAYQPAVDNYDEMAAFNVNAGDIFISTILNNAATVDTDTTKNWADTETHELEIRISKDRTTKFLVDGVDVTSVQATAFKFDANEVVIPFVYVLNAAASAPAVVVSKFAAIPSATWKS